MINKCCLWANSVLRNIFLFGGGSNPPTPPSDTCYVFVFNTVAGNNEISDLIYDNGTQNIGGSISPLSAATTEVEISQNIKDNIDGIITYEDVTVSRIDIGGGLFTYTITFKNTNFTIDVLDISGNSHPSTTTNCT